MQDQHVRHSDFLSPTYSFLCVLRGLCGLCFYWFSSSFRHSAGERLSEVACQVTPDQMPM